MTGQDSRRQQRCVSVLRFLALQPVAAQDVINRQSLLRIDRQQPYNECVTTTQRAGAGARGGTKEEEEDEEEEEEEEEIRLVAYIEKNSAADRISQVTLDNSLGFGRDVLPRFPIEIKVAGLDTLHHRRRRSISAARVEWSAPAQHSILRKIM